MDVAIVSNGPSARMADVSGFACVIAVNKAATLHRTTWWVVSDAEGFIEHAAKVKLQPCIGSLPQIFTRACVRSHVDSLFCRRDMLPLLDMMPTMLQDNFPYAGAVDVEAARTGTAWNQWSGLAALGLAYLMHKHHPQGCRFTLFGYDLDGDGDCLGEGLPRETHSRGMPDRWRRERVMTDAWIMAIEGAGAKVIPSTWR